MSKKKLVVIVSCATAGFVVGMTVRIVAKARVISQRMFPER